MNDRLRAPIVLLGLGITTVSGSYFIHMPRYDGSTPDGENLLATHVAEFGILLVAVALVYLAIVLVISRSRKK